MLLSLSTNEELYNKKTKWIDYFKRAWSPEIQQRRYARFYFGLNVIGQEAVVPIGMYSIPIPFMKGDHGFIRFKKVIPQESYSGHKIRCDQEIRRMERVMNDINSSKTLKAIAESQLKELKYISEGPYDTQRG